MKGSEAQGSDHTLLHRSRRKHPGPLLGLSYSANTSFKTTAPLVSAYLCSFGAGAVVSLPLGPWTQFIPLLGGDEGLRPKPLGVGLRRQPDLQHSA